MADGGIRAGNVGDCVRPIEVHEIHGSCSATVPIAPPCADVHLRQRLKTQASGSTRLNIERRRPNASQTCCAP
jgi:copper homeostasis protein CutC